MHRLGLVVADQIKLPRQQHGWRLDAAQSFSRKIQFLQHKIVDAEALDLVRIGIRQSQQLFVSFQCFFIAGICQAVRFVIRPHRNQRSNSLRIVRS